ncbi:hypothetical protein D3C73_735270 [compost metagenome]
MDDAVDVPQAHGTNGQALDGTQVAADVHVVVDGQGVFDDDEQPGDQVGHQRLCAKTDGQADHTGTRQQWRDVHAHVRQGDNQRDDENRHEQHVADQRHHRLRPRVRQALAGAGQGVVDRGVAENPDQPGKDQRAAEAEQLDAHFMAVTFGECNQRHAPDPQAEFDERQPHQQMRERVEKTLQALGVQGVTLQPPLRFLRVTAHQSVDDHAQHQQHGADQRLAQGGAGVAG